MTIYNINFNGNHYITDDNEIFEQNKDNKLIKSIIFGDDTVASNKLLELQNVFYTMEISRIYVSEIITDGENETWTPIDLDQHVINSTATYMIQTNIDNNRVIVTGNQLTESITTIKEQLLTMFKLDTYIIVESIPTERPEEKRLQPQSSGTTTI